MPRKPVKTDHFVKTWTFVMVVMMAVDSLTTVKRCDKRSSGLGRDIGRNQRHLHLGNETFEKCSILFKFKEGEDFNRRNTYSILRIEI